MSSKQAMLIALAVVLGGLSLYLNRDWFAEEDIQIIHRSRELRTSRVTRKRDNNATKPVVFLIDRRLKLTSVQVIPVSDIETNKYPHPIWHLVSDSNSVPIKEFAYGMNIKGMRPDVKGDIPDPLEPGVKYRLLIEAGPRKAQHDFTAVARAR